MGQRANDGQRDSVRTDDTSEASSHRASPVVAAAFRVLGECRAFAAGLDGGTYSSPSTLLVGGTIGKHLRHTLDHFAAVALALEGEPICYDRRARDVPMETEPGTALAEIHRVRELLGRARVEQLAAAVAVRIMCSTDGDEAEVNSTFERELAFATHHAIHHQAMMKAIAIEHGVRFEGGESVGLTSASRSVSAPAVPASFGVAPSTVVHATGHGARGAGPHSTRDRSEARPNHA